MGTPPVDGAGFSLTGEAVFWSLCRLVLGAAVYWLTALDPSVAAMVSSLIDHQFDVCFDQYCPATTASWRILCLSFYVMCWSLMAELAPKTTLSTRQHIEMEASIHWLLVVAVIVRDNELRFQLRLAVTSQTATTISQ